MRYLVFSDDDATLIHKAAVLVQRAIENSTGAPAPPTPPAGAPDAGALAWGRDMVAHGVPAQQAFDIVKAQWIKDGHTTPLTFTAADLGGAAPAPPDPPLVVRPNPYTGVGLYVIITQAGTASQAVRTRAEQAGIAIVGAAGWAKQYLANYGADPAWNSAVSQVIGGTSVDQVMSSLDAQGAHLEFTDTQLAHARDVAESLK